MRPSSTPEVGGEVEEAMHDLFCICVDICVFLCGVCVSSTPVSVCVCVRRSDLGAALMHKYPYTADTCGYSPSSSITHTVVCVILMYPKYPVSAILPHIKYPLVSWYPWHSRVTKNICASGISRQRRETLDSPQTRYVPRSYGAQSARFILDSRLPTSAPAQTQSAPLPAAMMTDENARCNAAMDGAGPAHSEPHDDAECCPIERNPDPPAALLHAPVACKCNL